MDIKAFVHSINNPTCVIKRKLRSEHPTMYGTCSRCGAPVDAEGDSYQRDQLPANALLPELQGKGRRLCVM